MSAPDAIGTASAGEVSLEAVLAAREARSERRAALSAEFGAAVVQLTICAPGPRKDGPDIRRAARLGAAFFGRALAAAELRVLHAESREGEAGPCFLWVVDAEAALVKQAAVGLEDGYRLGRLWDLDVHLPDGSKLDREAAGAAPRKCFVCGNPAAACAGRRVHGLAEVERRFGELMERGMEEMETKGVLE